MLDNSFNGELMSAGDQAVVGINQAEWPSVFGCHIIAVDGVMTRDFFGGSD